uniref:C2 domain-containing protein n=1 Tax=Knipowitschia caucasica TaxID=637954 RepID=A0AAV2MQ02_KNICA
MDDLLGTCLSQVQDGTHQKQCAAIGLPQDSLGITDGYVKVHFRSELLGQTEVRIDEANPWWREEFIYVDPKPSDPLTLEVHDNDNIWDDLVGICTTLVQRGTHRNGCVLEEGGMLFYDYTLS